VLGLLVKFYSFDVATAFSSWAVQAPNQVCN